MADDLEAELSALEDAAPLTEDTTDNDFGPGNPKPGDEPEVGAKAKDEKANGEADEWKPPNKETYENVQKALRVEREARRQEAQKARLYEQNVAKIEQSVQAWQQQQIAQRLQQPAPDPWQDPEGAKQWAAQQQQLQQQLWQAQQQREQQEVQRHQQEQHFQHVSSVVDDYEGEFTAQHPDYHEATDHMLAVQQSLLEGAGYPPEAARQQVAIWSVNVAQQALAAGRNPAEWAYENAKKMGYQPKGTGVQAATEKLAAMRAGQESSKTLSGGGAGTKGGTSLKQIASLEGAAFDSAMEKYLTDSIRGR